jgi:hypothetical protein
MDGLASIIAQLERQRTGIDQALAALREVEGIAPEAGGIDSVGAPARKGGMTPEGKKRLIKALKKRWAAKRAAAESAPDSESPTNKRSEGQRARWAAKKAALTDSAPAVTPTKATSKRGISAAGRKALADAMKRRWAVKRAAAKKQAKKAA